MSEGWKRRSTSNSVYANVDVDLDDFDTDQLLQALIDARAISEDEAVRIKKRGKLAQPSGSIFEAVPDDVDMAWTEIQRGRKSEALCHIERALGRKWIGRLS